jgi:ABC-type Mn2+/Zn2+ transport system permease subunit
VVFSFLATLVVIAITTRRHQMSTKETLTGAEALIRSLEMENVEIMFGLPGGCILPAYDPLLKSDTFSFVMNKVLGTWPRVMHTSLVDLVLQW